MDVQEILDGKADVEGGGVGGELCGQIDETVCSAFWGDCMCTGSVEKKAYNFKKMMVLKRSNANGFRQFHQLHCGPLFCHFRSDREGGSGAQIQGWMETDACPPRRWGLSDPSPRNKKFDLNFGSAGTTVRGVGWVSGPYPQDPLQPCSILDYSILDNSILSPKE